MSGDSMPSVTVDCAAFGAEYATLEHARGEAQLAPALVAKLLAGEMLSRAEVQSVLRFVALYCLVPVPVLRGDATP